MRRRNEAHDHMWLASSKTSMLELEEKGRSARVKGDDERVQLAGKGKTGNKQKNNVQMKRRPVKASADGRDR